MVLDEKKTWAERLTPRGNLVLIRCKINRVVLTADQTNPWSMSFYAEVVKVGPGMYNAVRGERVPIEYSPGEPVLPGDLVVVNPNAVFAPSEWKDELVALIPEGEIWSKLEPEAEGVAPTSSMLKIVS